MGHISAHEGVFMQTEYAKGPTFAEMQWTDRLRVLGAGSELIKITNKAGTKPKELAKVKHVRLGKKGKESSRKVK